MLVKFAGFNNTLGTRKLGSSIRQDVLKNIENEDKIIFDFEGVELISNSFADECFGKLVQAIGLDTLKKKTTFTSTNKLVALVVKKAIMDRSTKINTN